MERTTKPQRGVRAPSLADAIVLLTALVLVIFLCARQVPASPAIALSTLFAAALCAFLQPSVMKAIAAGRRSGSAQSGTPGSRQGELQ